MEEARFTLRIHPIIMNKMKHLAKINGRSVNKADQGGNARLQHRRTG